MPLLQQNKEYTIDDIYALPDGQRAELIDGKMYMMAPPTRRHQQILGALYRKIADYIDKKGGSCELDIVFVIFVQKYGKRGNVDLTGAAFFINVVSNLAIESP